MTQDALNDSRYRWMREAYVNFDDDDSWNKALEPLSLCYTPEEVDAAIDAELLKPENSRFLQAADHPQPRVRRPPRRSALNWFSQRIKSGS